MAPDRPDATDVEEGRSGGPVVTRVFGFCDAFSLKESEHAVATATAAAAAAPVPNHHPQQHFVEETVLAGDEVVIEEEVSMVKEEEIKEEVKPNPSDDELTSLSWLHQQNVLKGLDIREQQQQQQQQRQQQPLIKLEHVVCDDSLDVSENTNSVSSLDDSYSPADSSNGKNSSVDSTVLNYDEIIIGDQVQATNPVDKSPNGTAQTHPTINNIINNNNNSSSNANFNLPAPSRANKHPNHIPYDPQLHKNCKPPYSFSSLIFMAIEDSPVKALPVKEVYAWILEHFPYFRNAPTGWKNSVRHNLSLNKCFRKVEKAPVSLHEETVVFNNVGKGSLWMVDSQYRPNLLQSLSRSTCPPHTIVNMSPPEKTAHSNKSPGNRLPDPALFPYLSKRLASSNSGNNTDIAEFDSDVDAAAAAMLAFKHGPVIINHNNKEPKKKQVPNKRVPVITRSSTEDHTYSLITAVRLERRYDENESNDVDEQRKIAEGADALLNLAGVTTMPTQDPLAPDQFTIVQETEEEPEEEEEEDEYSHLYGSYKNAPSCKPGSDPLELPSKKRRTSASSGEGRANKRRKRFWRDTWTENGRYLKQVRG